MTDTGTNTTDAKPTAARPYRAGRADAPAYWHVDILWLMLATGDETGGRFSLMDELCPKGSGPPPHTHEQDEAFYVAHGAVTFLVGSETLTAAAGDYVYVPRGTPHGFRVDSETARLLNLYVPAGFEQVVVAAGTPAALRELPPKGLPMAGDPDAIRALLNRVGMRQVPGPDPLRPGSGDVRMAAPETSPGPAQRVPLADAVGVVLAENGRALAGVDAARLDELLGRVEAARRVFVLGEGRSGLVGRMFAMRLMHLGKAAFVVGEPTTPAVAAGDLLVVVSGSGTARLLTDAAATARAAGAAVAAVTADAASPLAAGSDAVVVIPAAGKRDRSGAASRQFAGSLFEQAALLLLDAAFALLAGRAGADAERLWGRHANLE